MSHRVAIGYVHPLMVNAHFSHSVLNAVREYGYETISVMSGPNISRARNLVVEHFLKTDSEKLFMVDTDMVFAVDAIERLDKDAKSIVSGFCFTGGEQPKPSMYRRVISGPDRGMYQSVSEWTTDSLFQVDVVGSACVLISRTVLTRIGRDRSNVVRWFQEIERDGQLIGEDFVFCERAAEVGYPTFVDTSVQVGHVKGTMQGAVR